MSNIKVDESAISEPKPKPLQLKIYDPDMFNLEYQKALHAR